MYLKRLDILGFKTFAEKTEVLFTPGVTAVVGPNGSGKSNISDAILWVLGEGNVRSLRGNTSQDVIFAGNERRKPLGMAEVSLTIDNTTRILPLDFSEVTVTRRVYRSGEGECFINRVGCRLKDVVELFMDTGLGRDAYSLVNQSEIDAILSVRSEDRRAIFEEAAGIKKYRHRKREAVRKLEHTRQNLLRINDIVAELESQLGPLARQAKVARRYEELAGRLRELEVAWLGAGLRRLTGERERLQELVRAIHAARDGVDAELDAIRREESAERVALQELEEDADRLRTAETAKRDALAAATTSVSLLRERVTTGDRRREALGREMRELGDRIADAQRRAEAGEAERGELLARIGELKRAQAEKLAEARAAGEGLESETRALEAERARLLELARRQAGARNQLAHLDRQQKSLAEALTSLGAEQEEAAAEVERAAAGIDTEEQHVAALAVALKEDETSLETLRLEWEVAQSAWKEAAAHASGAEQAWRALAARRAALAEMRDSYQGYEEGVRALLAAARDGKLGLEGQPGVPRFWPLTDAITVPAGLETAVEAALGLCAQAVVTETTAAALAAARFAREKGAGRIAILPLERLDGATGRRGDEATGRQGDSSLAAQIHADPEVAPAVGALLGQTAVAGSLGEATNNDGADPHTARVTPEGDVVAVNGAIFAGRARDGKERAASLLARRRELEELATRETEAEAAYRERAALTEARDGERERLRAAREERARRREQRRAEHAAAVKQQNLLRGERERAGRQVERLARQWEVAREEGVRARTERATVQAQLVESDEQAAALEASIASRQVELEARGAARRRLESELGDLRVELASLEERARTAAGASRRAIDGRDHAERQLQAKAAEQVTLQDDLAAAAAQIESAEGERASLSEQLEAIQADLQSLRERHAAFRDRAQGVADRLASENDRRTELTERAHQAELERTATEAEWNHLAAHLRNEYELEPKDAPPPDGAGAEALQHVSDPAGEIARLRRQVKSLGAVNPEAIEEHARLSERYNFLAEQRADLEQAQEQLHEAIREIDATTRETFMTAFRQIGAAFDEMFQRLFGGGRTELVLTDPHDVLETGIDIIVQPPGKKLQNLLLLSGGERALTAAAMLFALLKVRPSPFCVLDEVDAPLDEANVGRFSDVLREFAQRSQFIVITHNRGTMEAADTLYGVTMEEPGVSKIVSVRLSDLAADDAPATDREHEHFLERQASGARR